MNDVFISYSRHDREFVSRLVTDLEQEGLSVFFDQKISGGESWAESLSKAIESARYLLVVLSPDALQSYWIQQEVAVGLQRELRGKAKVIPLMVRECTPPGFLALKNPADFTQDYAAGLRQLLPVLRGSIADERAEGTPGSSDRKIDPAEFAQLRAELKEAVSLFKATPERREAGPTLPQSNRSRRKCFIVMPFGNENLQVVFEDFVRPVVDDRCDLDCLRGDDVFGSSVIMDDIRNSIDGADIVVADLTGKNANVFYEVGICHTVNKPVLLMAQSIEDVPFDLRHRRVLLYEYSPRGCKKLEKALEENLLAMIEKL